MVLIYQATELLVAFDPTNWLIEFRAKSIKALYATLRAIELPHRLPRQKMPSDWQSGRLVHMPAGLIQKRGAAWRRMRR